MKTLVLWCAKVAPLHPPPANIDRILEHECFTAESLSIFKVVTNGLRLNDILNIA